MAATTSELSPVSVKATVDDEASAVSPMSKSNVLESPVVVMLSVTVSQLPVVAEEHSRSTVFELPTNDHVPVYVVPLMTAAIVLALPCCVIENVIESPSSVTSVVDVPITLLEPS